MASKSKHPSSDARITLALPVVTLALLLGSTRTRPGRSLLERLSSRMNGMLLKAQRELMALEHEFDERSHRQR